MSFQMLMEYRVQVFPSRLLALLATRFRAAAPLEASKKSLV
jgi:hypothetical protein